MGPYLFLTAIIWHPSVVTWTTQQYRLRWGGISEVYNHPTSLKSSPIISTVPMDTAPNITQDVTLVDCSDEQELESGIGITSKIKV